MAPYFPPLLLCFLLLLVTMADTGTHPEDVRALRGLKLAVDPISVRPGSCLSTWDFSLDPCDHLFSDRFTCGFRCDRVDPASNSSRVTDLSLDRAGYSGRLTSAPWTLPYLQALDLAGNSFHGRIPVSFSRLVRLTRLSLSGNSLSGPIPDALSSVSTLEELYLDNNRLTRSIPASFNRLTRLKRLELQANRLSGELPDLSSIANLIFLDGSSNRFSGELSAALPSSVVELSLRNNHFSGTLPSRIGELLGFLQVLDLAHNNFSGAIPESFFNHPELEQLTLSHNRFTSLQVPPRVGNSKLIALDLSHNDLGGFLPAFMALLPELTALSLEQNKFTGMIPTQYALKTVLPDNGTASFERLLLGGNYLFGLIPGPLYRLKPGSANVSLVDNCLYLCPGTFFFCRGGDQKSSMDCKSFNPTIP